MAYLHRKVIGRSLSGHIDARLVFTTSALAQHIPVRLVGPAARLYHQSASAQDKASAPAPSPSPRPQQGKTRESLVWQRGERKETRNRISTLALDPNAIAEAEPSEAQQGSHRDQHSDQGASGQKPAGKILSRKQKRILLLSVVLLLPVIGRDIMEVLVPGVLGSIIFVGSKVKSCIKWIRSFGSAEDI